MRDQDLFWILQNGSILDASWEKKARKAKETWRRTVAREIELFGDPGHGQDSVEVNG